jgi:hypothetical protein
LCAAVANNSCAAAWGHAITLGGLAVVRLGGLLHSQVRFGIYFVFYQGPKMRHKSERFIDYFVNSGNIYAFILSVSDCVSPFEKSNVYENALRFKEIAIKPAHEA